MSERRRWYHGRNGWKYSQDVRCFYLPNGQMTPQFFCLGERMIHADYGYDTNGITWSGSTSESWHGFRFSWDFTKALKWVQDAKEPEYGAYLWGQNEKACPENNPSRDDWFNYVRTGDSANLRRDD